ISWIDENAGAADLLRAVRGAGVEISSWKFIKQIFCANRECVLRPAIGRLEIGEPCRWINLIILHRIVDAAIVTIASLPRCDIPRPLAVALHQASVVARLPARDRTRLQMIEEHGAE